MRVLAFAVAAALQFDGPGEPGYEASVERKARKAVSRVGKAFRVYRKKAPAPAELEFVEIKGKNGEVLKRIPYEKKPTPILGALAPTVQHSMRTAGLAGAALPPAQAKHHEVVSLPPRPQDLNEDDGGEFEVVCDEQCSKYGREVIEQAGDECWHGCARRCRRWQPTLVKKGLVNKKVVPGTWEGDVVYRCCNTFECPVIASSVASEGIFGFIAAPFVATKEFVTGEDGQLDQWGQDIRETVKTNFVKPISDQGKAWKREAVKTTITQGAKQTFGLT